MALIQNPVQGTTSAYANEIAQLGFSRSVVQQHISSPVYFRCIPTISITPTMCSTKVPNERTEKMNSGLISTRHQVDPKKELSRILRTDAAVKGIERKANSEKYLTLWPKAVLEALDEAIKENRWQSALKIFNLLRKQHWYEPRCKTYTKLFKVLGNCKQPDQASLLFEVMLSEGLKPTIDVYTSLISVYGKSELLDKAFSTLEYMKSVSDCKPDVFTFTVLISCCCKLGRFDLVKSVVLEMSYLGVGCSTVTYNTIIDGYGKAGMFEEMESVLADMIEDGDSLPDVCTLNSIIGSYGNGRNMRKMESWYSRFQLMEVQPDITTFNILILSFGKAVIETFGKAGRIEKMDDVFRKMKYQGVKPNSITYCSLVNAYSKAGLVVKIDSVLRQIVNSDVVLDTPFFNCIINAYGQAGDLATMKELYIQMEERKFQELEKQMISSDIGKKRLTE
ncbi:unnamed protein product [Arabidopsis thaliana]|uniref:(thale cress) hypothetical protein n=1 Tax=Arabidopsis thaliana TaxID=3702 RepID=A0A7G2EUR1_ARATH|nr:unnamed protein product [Arabidopsis thaliana]